MPIDHRLAFEALEGMRDPIGPGIVSGINTYNQMQDRQRADQERAKMQSLGQFVGQEFAGGAPDYNAITGRIAEINPLKAIEMDQNRLAKEQALKIAQMKSAPKAGLDPTFLNNAAVAKYESRQLLEAYKKEKDPVIKDEIAQQYGALNQNYATTTKPNILGMKDPSNKLTQLEIPTLEDALQGQRVREVETGMKQSQLNQQLRAGAIKDEEFVSKSIKDYENLASKDGHSLIVVNNLNSNLGRLHAMAKKGNVAAMHGLNIIANKGLDPDSAVLLAEAEAFDDQSWQQAIIKMGSRFAHDVRKLNVDKVHEMAKSVLSGRTKNAQKLAKSKLNSMNKQLKNMGSKRVVTLDEISAFAKPSFEDL